jgi:mono/diheme cytochrome c family protein
VGNGIPYDVYRKLVNAKPDSVLARTGINAGVSYGNTVFENAEGLQVISGNCFTCHASKLNGEVVLGLGNSFSDYTRSSRRKIGILNWMVRKKYGKDSPEWASYEEQARWFASVGSAVKMENPGINPAFRVEEAAIRFRDPGDLTFLEVPNFKLSKATIGTDVPPLWNVAKKEALYYNGMGRGDFTKLLMQACLLGIHDSTAARAVQGSFGDVVAWLRDLKPPSYPGKIDQQLAKEGMSVFHSNCQKCHGSYGEKGTYPNKLVPLNEVGTDPTYALYAMASPVNEWYNASWFAQSEPRAESRPSPAYIAPPLDGIWATAPFLHNGSVPTLQALLDSRLRPVYWERDYDCDQYDLEMIGWPYTEKSRAGGRYTYDTSLPGYGNAGHTFGDSLSSRDRTAVLEYLKSL